ncbi:MAG: hypothetical protein JWM11_1823 [Planctomycetaceae bacterium]|nr:hypothetical protein [Planctomycetaceae bacterium]
MPNFTQTTACFLMTLAGAAAAHSETLVMEKHTVHDTMAANHDALTFLKPQGWTVQGGVKWYLNSTHQACLEVKVANPKSLEQVETLPWSYATWITNPVFPLQTGSNYMGNIVMQPISDPREVVRTLTIPAFRPGARIVASQEMPEIAKALSASMGCNVRSSRIRLEYNVNGQAVEEDIYVSIYVTSFNLGLNNAVSYLWGPAWTPFALRAPKGELDALTPKLLTIVNSAQFNPQWYAEYSGVCKLFQLRMANDIDNARRLSETITRNSNEIFEMFSDSYWKRQASQDRLAQNFSDTIRGVDRYTSPYEKYPIQLPSGYQNAWAGANGTYVLSNDAGYDPNVGSTTSWTLMNMAR